MYWNFFLDFGPLNLGQLYRFSQKLNSALANPRLKDKTIYFFSGTHPHRRTNAAALICSWSIVYLDLSPDEAYAPFRGVYPGFTPFHDATPITCTYNLTVRARGHATERKGHSVYVSLSLCTVHRCTIAFAAWPKRNTTSFSTSRPLTWTSTSTTSRLNHLSPNRAHRFLSYAPAFCGPVQVENGDLNWHQEGKWLAFAGPHENREVTADGYQTLTVEDYGPYFQKKGITLVVSAPLATCA